MVHAIHVCGLQWYFTRWLWFVGLLFIGLLWESVRLVRIVFFMKDTSMVHFIRDKLRRTFFHKFLIVLVFYGRYDTVLYDTVWYDTYRYVPYRIITLCDTVLRSARIQTVMHSYYYGPAGATVRTVQEENSSIQSPAERHCVSVVLQVFLITLAKPTRLPSCTEQHAWYFLGVPRSMCNDQCPKEPGRPFASKRGNLRFPKRHS